MVMASQNLLNLQHCYTHWKKKVADRIDLYFIHCILFSRSLLLEKISYFVIQSSAITFVFIYFYKYVDIHWTLFESC